MGDVGIGTETPGAKLEIAGQVKITGGTPAAGEVLTTDATGLATWSAPAAPPNGVGTCRPTGFEYDTLCSTPRLTGDLPCPIWKDCDGDGHTYGGGDCDENCTSCFVGSTARVAADGRDQDCNGLVDEKVRVGTRASHTWHGTTLAAGGGTANLLCYCQGFPLGVYHYTRSTGKTWNLGRLNSACQIYRRVYTFFITGIYCAEYIHF